MRTIIDYKTMYSDNPGSLDPLVSDLIRRGWQPYGSPYTVSGKTAGVCICAQALVKYQENPTESK